MKQLLLICAVVMSQSVLAVDKKPLTKEESATVDSIFNTEEILDENTLETKTLQDWHPVGATRQKLIEINVAQWWPGQDYRIPVRLIVPLEGKAKGFSITGANPYETLMKDARPTDFQAKLLAGGVGIVKTHVKAFRQIPGKQGLEQKMRRVFLEDLNPRYTTLWIWSMTLMRATTAAYAESDHFEKGKVAGQGNSKNGISPAVALINDERFTATCSDHAFAYYSPTRRADREEMAKADAANKAFFEAVKAGDIELEQQRGKIYQRVMVGSERSMDKMARETGRSMDEMQTFADRLWSSVCVAENWDRLMERGVDILFQPGTHDYVAYDILWGAQNHPQLPVYYKPSGGHSQTPHVAAAKDEQNRDAFLWNHFFGGESLLSPPASSHKVDKDKLSVRVSFDEGPQSKSGRIWWIYDRAPAGSAPFLHAPIPQDQWADMKRDPKTGSWTATIPLQKGASRIDFFTNHGHMSNGYRQYLSSPYTRVELSASQPNAQAQQPSEEQLARILKRFPEADTDKDGKLNTEEIQQFRQSRQRNTRPAAAAQPTQAGDAKLTETLAVFAEKGGGPDQETKEQFIKRVEKNTKKSGKQLDKKAIEARFQEMDANQDGIVTREERRARVKEAPKVEKATVGPIFNTEEILDESTLDIKTLQDWHVDEVTGSTRQKLIEINVAKWWPGQDYRIPVRLIVPLEGKAKGFSITGANPYEGLMEDSRPTDFQAKLLAGGVGIVETHVKAFRQIPGKRGLEQKMMRMFMKDLNPRYTTLWIWSMTLMRATTAAYAEGDHFEKGKVAGSGSSKNGISPAVALINDERFTATCSDHAFAYYSLTRRGDREAKAKAGAANKAFFEAVKAGDIDLDPQRGKIYQRVMVGSEGGMDKMMQSFSNRLLSSVCVSENWDRLMERGVDILFEPGTHDYVAYDILWGAQNHPQVPVYYQPNGGHSQTPHVAAAKDEQNRDAFLWNHFFGGDSLLSPPASSHKVDKGKLSVSVSFNEGPQPTSGRIWWMYDRAPAGSAPFLHIPIPEDQWANMERDPKTGSWTATIPLKEGASRIDFFSNHGHMANGYQQYHSSPYTRVELSAEAYSKTQRKPAAAPSTNAQAQQPSEKQLTQILKRFPEADTDKDGKLNAEEIQKFLKSRQRNRRPAAAAQPTQAGDAKLTETLAGMNARFKNVEVELLEWPGELHEKLGKMTKLALVTRPVEKIEGKLPLLINLHGGGQRWWNNSFQQQLVIAAQMGMKRGFDLAELAGKGLIVLDPNTAERWNADSLDTMLDYVLENFPGIDKDRVYVMGYSAGGGATWRWINQSTDRFAAAAPCGFSGGSDKDDMKKLTKLPIWAMAGGDDGKNPAGIRKMVERLKAAGNVNVKHAEIEGADHRAGGRAVFSSVELVDWMLGFKRPRTTE